MTSQPAPPATIPPDTKDWTWVLDEPCGECGFDASDVDRDGYGDAFRDDGGFWRSVLGRDVATLTTRPDPQTWSVLEYACHVRDVHRVFADRLRQMLTTTDPGGARFANWDQDEAAIEGAYHRAHPSVVVGELVASSAEVADAYDAVPGDAWGRIGLRSNGSRFTVGTLGAYHLHDVMHHRWDVRSILGG